jgi:glycosyltransferase involved in cell wall biosynthesis
MVDDAGLSRARNAGASAAKGDILIFADSDIMLNQSFPWIWPDADYWIPRFATPLKDSSSVGTNSIVRHLSGFTYGPFIAVTRRAFDAVGGFEETVFEDCVLSNALRHHGFVGANLDLTVYHLKRPTSLLNAWKNTGGNCGERTATPVIITSLNGSEHI